jgi:hypothetical protein
MWHHNTARFGNRPSARCDKARLDSLLRLRKEHVRLVLSDRHYSAAGASRADFADLYLVYDRHSHPLVSRDHCYPTVAPVHCELQSVGDNELPLMVFERATRRMSSDICRPSQMPFFSFCLLQDYRL